MRNEILGRTIGRTLKGSVENRTQYLFINKDGKIYRIVPI